MRPQDVKYEILCEIENEKPQIQIGFQFNDHFETNTYYLISEVTGFYSADRVPFSIIKDNEEIGRVFLVGKDVQGLLADFLEEAKDHDMKKILMSKYAKTVEHDVINFLEYHKKSVIEDRSSLSGEIKRMRSVAGIV